MGRYSVLNDSDQGRNHMQITLHTNTEYTMEIVIFLGVWGCERVSFLRNGFLLWMDAVCVGCEDLPFLLTLSVLLHEQSHPSYCKPPEQFCVAGDFYLLLLKQWLTWQWWDVTKYIYSSTTKAKCLRPKGQIIQYFTQKNIRRLKRLEKRIYICVSVLPH